MVEDGKLDVQFSSSFFCLGPAARGAGPHQSFPFEIALIDFLVFESRPC